MIIACPSCETRYRVNESSIPPEGRSTTCRYCDHVWHEMPPGAKRPVEAVPSVAASMFTDDAEASADRADVTPILSEISTEAEIESATALPHETAPNVEQPLTPPAVDEAGVEEEVLATIEPGVMSTHLIDARHGDEPVTAAEPEVVEPLASETRPLVETAAPNHHLGPPHSDDAVAPAGTIEPEVAEPELPTIPPLDVEAFTGEVVPAAETEAPDLHFDPAHGDDSLPSVAAIDDETLAPAAEIEPEAPALEFDSAVTRPLEAETVTSDIVEEFESAAPRDDEAVTPAASIEPDTIEPPMTPPVDAAEIIASPAEVHDSVPVESEQTAIVSAETMPPIELPVPDTSANSEPMETAPRPVPLRQAAEIIQLPAAAQPATRHIHFPVETTGSGSRHADHEGGGHLLAWIGLAASILLILSGVGIFRDDIVTAWPAVGRAYAALGLPAAAGTGLELSPAIVALAADTGRPTFLVAGTIANKSWGMVSVPKLRVSLLDENQRQLTSVDMDAGKSDLRPGEMTTFSLDIEDPPSAAAKARVVFAGS